MRNKSKNLFWISFSDIMTSLFFVVLVLFVVSAVSFNNQLRITETALAEAESAREIAAELNVIREEYNQIQSIQNSIRSLDSRFFEFDENNKRYRLRVDVNFQPRSPDINTVGQNTIEELVEAGRNLYQNIDSILREHEDSYLILVIEGNAQRVCRGEEGGPGCNYIYEPDFGYNLSYRRALALFNLWHEHGMDFKRFGDRCEIILAGSGYFGISREEQEQLNRRFTLQLTSKWTLDSRELGS